MLNRMIDWETGWRVCRQALTKGSLPPLPKDGERGRSDNFTVWLKNHRGTQDRVLVGMLNKAFGSETN